jgi:hypothetical protein
MPWKIGVEMLYIGMMEEENLERPEGKIQEHPCSAFHALTTPALAPVQQFDTDPASSRLTISSFLHRRSQILRVKLDLIQSLSCDFPRYSAFPPWIWHAASGRRFSETQPRHVDHKTVEEQ